MNKRGQLSIQSFFVWRLVQSLIWVIGLFIVFCLIIYPSLGIHLFWNILIPVAPALLVIAVGLWRNICPMASTALFPRHRSFSKRKKLSLPQTGKLNLIAVIALFVIVPLRHVLFNANGLASAFLLIGLAIIAVIMGFSYEWKSGWCSGLCPIHPVEKLYGTNNQMTFANAHCDSCHSCVTPCPDSTPGIHPGSVKKTSYHKIATFLMVGAFPGFVWGWFQVPDFTGVIGFEQLVTSYYLPFVGMLVTSLVYLILQRVLQERIVVGLFSTAAVSCYYWFRLPALFGFGLFPGDGMLVDLSSVLPAWSMLLLTIGVSLFFLWWIVLRGGRKVSWVIRPDYADENS